MKYHQKTIDFLIDKSVTIEDAHHPLTIEHFNGDSELLPMTSNAKVDQIVKLEQEKKLYLPEAVKEWLLYPQSRLWFYVRTNRHIYINELNEFDLFESEKLILSMFTDEIGVTEWGIELNGNQDPPVYTKYTDDDPESWYKASPTFSQFIYDNC